MKYVSLFSGIGAFEKAFSNLKIPLELVAYFEIDKYASKAYSLIHGVSESLNFGDITKFDENIPVARGDIDLITYGFPCQPFSVAGSTQGFEDSKGRGNLFFDALHVIKHYKPKVAIAENVKNLASKKFATEFAVILQSLQSAGYTNYWKILNAKNFGVAQNRERVFIVSVRKDVDTGAFRFPAPYNLHNRLYNYLDTEVPTKFYLTKTQVAQIKNSKFKQEYSRIQDKHGVCRTLTVSDYKRPICIQVGQMYNENTNPQAGRIYATQGISPTLDSMQGGNRMPKILLGAGSENVRKLTPLECFRLMGFDDKDCQICIDNGISNTQLYKMAGNSIVVDVLEEIFCMMFDSDNRLWI